MNNMRMSLEKLNSWLKNPEDLPLEFKAAQINIKIGE